MSVLASVVSSCNAKQALASEQSLRTFEKHILLPVLDEKWKEHLSTMDHLRHFPCSGAAGGSHGLAIQSLSWEPLISIEHTYPEKTVLLDVWIVKELHGKAHGLEGQAVRWVAPNMLDQFEFPEANDGIIGTLNI